MLNPEVKVREETGVLVAEFWDCLRLDPTPVRELHDAFERHQRTRGRSEVVIDMNGIGFAGSAALGGFVALKKHGARLIFCNVDPNVREVFLVSKLDPLFMFVTDLATALELAQRLHAGPLNGSKEEQSLRPTSVAKVRGQATSAAPLRRTRGRSST